MSLPLQRHAQRLLLLRRVGRQQASLVPAAASVTAASFSTSTSTTLARRGRRRAWAGLGPLSTAANPAVAAAAITRAHAFSSSAFRPAAAGGSGGGCSSKGKGGAGGDGAAAGKLSITITRGTDRPALDALLPLLPEPLDFVNRGTYDIWRDQEANVDCHFYAALGRRGGDSEKEELLGFVTLYQVEQDPQRKHQNPHLLNLVYVAPRCRHRGLAVELVRRAAADFELTALCTSEEYTKVCERAGLKRGDSGDLAPLVVMAN